ncbi:MAG: ParB N-terminal domain-containing protein [Kiritimatiellaeota bacterium]|nr:ParB N-terminal domain-containing protein [Kiritimatiellota bacterium]
MTSPLQINGVDIPLASLTPLKERDALNIKSHKGFLRIRSSIKAIGLIEPLCVFPEGNGYVILDGYLRFRACADLKIEIVPCIVFPNKEAYTFNRMVNRLSGYQEMRMLRKSLETLDERTIADVFGMRSIRYRLAPTLVEQLHPKVAEAFETDLLGKAAAREMSCVLPERQAEMLKEMKRVHDFSPAFIRALILKTPPELRNPKRNPKKPWSEDKKKRGELVSRLEEAEKQHDFYTKLYRQYTADLLKMTLYVRKIVTTPDLNAYLQEHQTTTLRDLSQLVLETPAPPAPA